jgi:regulator of replication initiation timing
MFNESCQEWCRKPDAEKTWARFKVHFTEAHHDWRLAQGTTQTEGYHGANNAMDSFVNETADAFANLATATASGQQMLADLTATNKELTQLMAKKDTEISSLKKKLQDRSNNRDRNTNTPRDRDSTKRRYTNTNYCWTHGFDIHNTHTSQSCNFPSEGHQRDATRADTKGGSTANKEKVA